MNTTTRRSVELCGGPCDGATIDVPTDWPCPDLADDCLYMVRDWCGDSARYRLRPGCDDVADFVSWAPWRD